MYFTSTPALNSMEAMYRGTKRNAESELDSKNVQVG